MQQSAQDYLNNRLSDLRSERSGHLPDWQSLTKNFSPFNGRYTRTSNRRQRNKNTMLNNTPLFARRVLSSGMMTGISSPSRPWFRFGPPDDQMNEFGPVRGWLDIAEKFVYQVFTSSNLYRVLPKVYEAVGTMGIGCMIQDEDFDSIFNFKQFPTGEYMLAVDANGIANTFAREYQMTVMQIIEKFGIDEVSPNVRTNYDNGNYTTMIDINHLIEPINDSNAFEEFKISDVFNTRSVYYEVGRTEGNEKFLGIKGYHEFPVFAPRWDVQTEDIYGFGPGHECVGDAMSLQIKEREKGKAIAKQVAPPMVAPTSARRANLSVLPGKFNFTNDPGNVFKPLYQVNAKISELNLDIERNENRINRAFYVDLFLMLANLEGIQPRNELELIQREQEKLLQLGPVLQGVHDELLKPLINRTFNGLVRLSEPSWNGMSDQELLPPPPAELQGVELKVEFISVLAQAQKAVATSAIDRWVNFTTGLATFKPDVLDKMNGDELVETYAEDLGVPNNIIVSNDRIAEIRKARDAAKSEAIEKEEMAQEIQTVKTASEIKGVVQ